MDGRYYITSPLSYLVETEGGHIWHRHIDHIRDNQLENTTNSSECFIADDIVVDTFFFQKALAAVEDNLFYYIGINHTVVSPL